MKMVNDISDSEPSHRDFPRTAWGVYKRRFVPMQILIIIVCVVLYFFVHTTKEKLIAYIIMLEFFAIVSAIMGARMARKIMEGDE